MTGVATGLVAGLGRRALVTGAGGGIGRVLVARLRGLGVAVAAADQTTDGLDVDASLPGDLTDARYCDALPDRASDALGGPIDLLVNNAGVIARGPVTDTSDADFRQSVAINIEAPFRLCRAAISVMAGAGGGAIVNVASCWGVHPGPNHAVYCMTKAALASLTQCMGRDHAHQGVRINAVCPNEVDTSMLRTGFAIRGLDPATAIADLDQTVPVGRIAQPEDIVDVILFLASDQSRYLCGALIEANGGKPVG